MDLQLPFVATMQEISDAEIMRRCKSARDALRVCIELSGLCPKEVAYHLELDQGHLSRMITASGESRHFPPDLFNKLQDLCGNEVPIRWLTLSRGYGMHRLKSELERENDALRIRLNEQEQRLATITDFIKQVKGSL
jgi:hypothetical protein